MLPLRIAGSTNTLGAPPGWDEARHGPCAGLPVRVDDFNGVPLQVSAWDFTPEERELVAAGGVIELSIMAAGHPPVGLDVRLTASGRQAVPMTDLEKACVEWATAETAHATALLKDRPLEEQDELRRKLIEAGRQLHMHIHNLVTLKGPL